MLSDQRTKEKPNGPPISVWVSLIVLLLDHTNRSQWDISAQICTFEQGTFPRYGKGTMSSVTLPWHWATICSWQNVLFNTRKLGQEITLPTLQKPLSPRIMHQPVGQSDFPKRISSYTGFPSISHVQTCWCIALLITVSGGYLLLTQGKNPQQPEQETRTLQCMLCRILCNLPWQAMVWIWIWFEYWTAGAFHPVGTLFL